MRIEKLSTFSVHKLYGKCSPFEGFIDVNGTYTFLLPFSILTLSYFRFFDCSVMPGQEEASSSLCEAKTKINDP
jgi:hypothetical protein